MDFPIFCLNNYSQNVNGNLPFFLWITQPFDYLVTINVFVFDEFLEFDDRVAYSLDKLGDFRWIFKLAFDDVWN